MGHTLRYDPVAEAGCPMRVWHEGRQIQVAKPVDLYANCFVKRNHPAHTPRAPHRNRASASRVIRAEITCLSLEANQRPVLIVDEAHHLRNDVLEDLRLLTNYERQTPRTGGAGYWWG